MARVPIIIETQKRELRSQICKARNLELLVHPTQEVEKNRNSVFCGKTELLDNEKRLRANEAVVLNRTDE